MVKRIYFDAIALRGGILKLMAAVNKDLPEQKHFLLFLGKWGGS